MNIRICGYLAEAFSSPPLRTAFTGNCMLDCPEASQTSPTKTSLTVTVFLPLTVRGTGSLAESGSSLTLHFPVVSAVTVLVCPAMVTVQLRGLHVGLDGLLG